MRADLPTLQALLARVEAATGPDRELDELIHRMFIDPMGRSMDEFQAARRAGAPLRAAPYTASVDAAWALIMRVLSDPHIQIGGPAKYLNIPTPIPNYWRVDLARNWPAKDARGWGANIALALLAAMLRALIAEREAKGE